MKDFERPIAELIALEGVDIITTSLGGDDDDEWSSDSDVEWSE